jgi:thymidylate synthase (FAD)
MEIIKPSYEILTDINGDDALKIIELAGRTCYKSEDKITEDSSTKFANMICNVYKHESVMEHYNVSVRFICNRGFTHEIVRHRIASFSQESTRYVNYVNKTMKFIKPNWFEDDTPQMQIWESAMFFAEENYVALIEEGATPQQARGVLPIDIKTEIVVTTNLREWKHILKLRTSKQAHPSMHELMRPLLKEFQEKVPVVFDDVEY